MSGSRPATDRDTEPPASAGSADGSQPEVEQSVIEPGPEPQSTGREDSAEVLVQVSSHAVVQLIASGKLFAGNGTQTYTFSPMLFEPSSMLPESIRNLFVALLRAVSAHCL